MEPYAKIDTLAIWGWVDSARIKSDIRISDGNKSEAIALIERGFRDALDQLVDYLKELDEGLANDND